MPKITRIVVNAGRTFNHPYEQYSNLRPEVTLEASLADGEDAVAATRGLQATAEGLVEDHKRNMLKSIEDLYQLTQRQQEVRGLQAQLTKAQERLSTIRREHPELQQLEDGSPAQQESNDDVPFR